MWRRGKLAFALLTTQIIMIITLTLRALTQGFKMILLVHGFCMCQFTNYTFHGIGCNFLMSIISIQWSTCLQLFRNGSRMIGLDARRLLDSIWASLSVTISLSSLHGKTSPLQMLILTLSETTLYTLNDHFVSVNYGVFDGGYAIRVFLFGSFFGLGSALVVWKQKLTPIHTPHAQKLRTSLMNNLCLLISSILTFCLWPEFLAALTSGDKKHRVIINAYLAMSCAVVTGFMAGSFADPKNRFSVKVIQISVMSGAVGISGLSMFMLNPHGALTIGGTSALLSVLSYAYLMPLVSKKFQVPDSFHVVSRFGIPSLLSGVLSAVFALMASEKEYGSTLYEIFPARSPKANSSELEEILLYLDRVQAGDGRTNYEQAAIQLLAVVTSIFFGFFSGIITGCLIRFDVFDPLSDENVFNDGSSWILPEQDVSVIGNESWCETDFSEATGQESAAMQTLKPPQNFRSNHQRSRSMSVV